MSRAAVIVEDYGRAVQVEPMKPVLKAPVVKRLQPKYDEPLSNFAFNVNLRRYTMAQQFLAASGSSSNSSTVRSSRSFSIGELGAVQVEPG